MSKRRFFIGGVELEENGRRDFVLHLIDLKKKRMHRFSSRDQVGQIVAFLCSPLTAQSIRQECLMDRREIAEGEYLRGPTPVYGKNIPASLDDLEEVSSLVQENNPRALMLSQDLSRLIRQWENFYLIDEDFQNLNESDGEQFFEEPDEIEAAFIVPQEEDDLGSGAIFNFEHDFTFNIEDVPDDLRQQYHILSFDTAEVAAIQSVTVKNCIYRALEDAGIRTPENKEIVPAGIKKVFNPQPKKNEGWTGMTNTGSPDTDVMIGELTHH